HGHACARRRRALVQGHARARGGARLGRGLSLAAPAAADGRRPLRADVAIAAALGALQTIAYAHTWLWPLQIACIAGLVHLAARRHAGGAALLGLAYGSAWLGA